MRTLYFFPVVSIFFFSSPNLSCRTWCGLSANLECRSEMCCTRLAENTGRKDRHLCTIAQLCQAISSQRRHIDYAVVSVSVVMKFPQQTSHDILQYLSLEMKFRK